MKCGCLGKCCGEFLCHLVAMRRIKLNVSFLFIAQRKPFCTCRHATVKGIVHFEIKIWYLSAYPKGIQDVGVFFSSVDPILMFLGQTVLVCQSYNGRYRSLSL